eukprot:949132_1
MSHDKIFNICKVDLEQIMTATLSGITGTTDQIAKNDIGNKNANVLFTLKEINECNGVNTNKILICIDGLVFDCSSGKNKYGPKGGYHIFAGHDITYALAMNSLKQDNVDKFGVCQFNQEQLTRLNGWKTFFLDKYELIGRLQPIEDDVDTSVNTLTLAQLNEYNGVTKGDLIYICVDGTIFDVTKGKQYYGVGGSYHLFAGNDCTYNLAIDSLDKKHLNTFQFELDLQQQKTVNKWKAFYQKRYIEIGKLDQVYVTNKGSMHSKL